MFNLKSENFLPDFANCADQSWLSRDALNFIEKNFDRVRTNLNSISPNEVGHRISLLSDLTGKLLLDDLEGSLSQLLLGLSCNGPRDVSIFFTFVKKDDGFEFFEGAHSTKQGIKSIKAFSKKLLKTFLMDPRNRFRGVANEDFLFNLLDPRHFSRVDVPPCLCACAITFLIKPSRVPGRGLPYLSELKVCIDFFPYEAREEDDSPCDLSFDF